MAAVNKMGSFAFVIFLLFAFFGGISTLTNEDLKAAICGPQNGLYNIENLTKAKVWSLNYTESKPTCIDSNNQTIGCDFMFAFCHGYNCSETDKTLMNTSACLMVESKNKSLSKTYKLGSYNPNVNPFEDASEGSMSKFVVHFTNGGPFHTTNNKTCVLQMDMVFTCNQSGLWTQGTQGQTKATVNRKLLRKITYDPLLCKYNLDFNYNGACPVIIPLPVPETGLSTGTVLIIIFFVSIAVYFIVGCSIKCLRGDRGKEILPNSAFWVMLPVYIADGFIFTCERCCCCKPTPESGYDRI